MSETTLAQTLPEQQTETQGRQEMTIPLGSLGNNFFGVETAEEQKPSTTQAEEPKPTTITPEVKPEEVKVDVQPVTATEWYKELGFENPDTAKTEISKLKDQKPVEVKFENEQSKHIYELLQQGKSKEVKEFLETQEKLDSYLTVEVNSQTAEDIIKLGMQIKYQNLTHSEINYKFNKEYGIPAAPVQANEELDEDFAARKNEWSEKVKDIEMTRTIEAKLVKPELEKHKSQLVLPEIGTQQAQQKPPTQEELEAAKKFDAAFIESVDNSIKEFNGFSVKVKNEAVGLAETSIDYLIPEAEKQLLASEMKDFVEQGYNANSVFSQRWVNQDNTLNTKLMSEDRYWLTNRDKILQKVANDSATKAIDTYLKGKRNIDINETNQQGTSQVLKEDKTELDIVREQFFG